MQLLKALRLLRTRAMNRIGAEHPLPLTHSTFYVSFAELARRPAASVVHRLELVSGWTRPSAARPACRNGQHFTGAPGRQADWLPPLSDQHRALVVRALQVPDRRKCREDKSFRGHTDSSKRRPPSPPPCSPLYPYISNPHVFSVGCLRAWTSHLHNENLRPPTPPPLLLPTWRVLYLRFVLTHHPTSEQPRQGYIPPNTSRRHA